MQETVEIELTKDTILDLPQSLYYYKKKDYLLVISQNTANWIGLFNENQEKIFSLLYEKKSLGEVMELSNGEYDINFVVGQIVDRNFLATQIVNFNSPHNEGLYIYLTNDCNLACRHCYMYSGKPNTDELAKEDWFTIIKNAQNNEIKTVTFTGGEVLKYKDWFDVIKFAKNCNMQVTILTNGILWSQEKIIKSKPYIDEVQISLDGTNEIQNSTVRGRGNFQQTIDSIKLFVKAGVKTVVATTPTLENIYQVEKTYIKFAKDLLEELKSENLYFKISQKLMTGRKVEALIKDKAKEYSKITRNLANTLYPKSDIRNFINNMPVGTGLKNCGYGGLSISSDGKFFLCNRVENLDAIATNKDDFTKVLEKANYYYEWSSVDNTVPCMSCDIKYICGGGCRIDEYHFAGKQDQVSEDEPLTKIDCSDEYKNSIYEKMIGNIKYTYQVD